MYMPVEIKKRMSEMLEKQMELLFERTQNTDCTVHELVETSQAMTEIAKMLMYPAWCQEAAQASRRC